MKSQIEIEILCEHTYSYTLMTPKSGSVLVEIA